MIKNRYFLLSIPIPLTSCYCFCGAPKALLSSTKIGRAAQRKKRAEVSGERGNPEVDGAYCSETAPQHTRRQTGGLFEKAPSGTVRCANWTTTGPRGVAAKESTVLHPRKARELLGIHCLKTLTTGGSTKFRLRWRNFSPSH